MVFSADNLQVFLAVARTGRLVRAAEDMGLDHSTVGRRIAALEKAVGHRLFDRTPDGWRVTERGRALIASAEAIERAMASAREAIDSTDATLSGPVRVLCPDGFGVFLLAPALGKLLSPHPRLSVEMVTAPARLEPAMRDFDLAVTLGDLSSPGVVTRPLSDYLIKVYASRDYLESHGPVDSPQALRRHRTVWYGDKLRDVLPLHAVDRMLPRPADIQSTNVVAQWQAIAAGNGVGPLPQFIARQDPRLVRVLPAVEIRERFWLVVPRQHMRLPRVRTMTAFLEAMVRDRAEDLHSDRAVTPPSPRRRVPRSALAGAR